MRRPLRTPLLGLGQTGSEEIVLALVRRDEIAKSGRVHLNLSPLMTDEKLGYIARAVDNRVRMAANYMSDDNVETDTTRVNVRDVPEDSLSQ